METPAGEQLGWVLGTYFAVLFPWAILYAHDFINEQWRTVKYTRWAGYRHLLFVSAPLPVIMYYTVLQAQAEEYTEMSMGITAMLFSSFHFARTVWGLVQLWHFTRWAQEAVLKLTSLQCEMANHQERSSAPWNDSFVESRLPFDSEKESVDLMLVNNSVVDNEIFGGAPPQYGIMLAGWLVAVVRRAFRRKLLQYAASHTAATSRLFARDAPPSKTVCRLVAVMLYKFLRFVEQIVLQLVVKCVTMLSEFLRVTMLFVFGIEGRSKRRFSLDDIDERIAYDRSMCSWLEYTSDESLACHFVRTGDSWYWRKSVLDLRQRCRQEEGWPHLAMYPKDPHATWVRWAVTFIAQRGLIWAQRCSAAPVFYNRYTEADQVAAFAALQVTPVSGRDQRRLKSHMPLVEWDAFSPSFMDPGVQSLAFRPATLNSLKHALLEVAFESGRALPFSYPDPLLLSGDDEFQEWSAEGERLLQEAVESLAPKESLAVSGLKYSQLEWFAVLLLPRGRWAIVPQHLNQWNICKGLPSSRDRKLAVLRTQLNLDGSEEGEMERLGFIMSGARTWETPVGAWLTDSMRHDCERFAGERAFQISHHVDNWLALSSGIDTEAWLRRTSSNDMLRTRLADMRAESNMENFDDARQHRVAALHAELATRARCGNRDAQSATTSRLSQTRSGGEGTARNRDTMIFAGCAMNALRAALVLSVKLHLQRIYDEKGDTTSLNNAARMVSSRVTRIPEVSVDFTPSEELYSALHRVTSRLTSAHPQELPFVVRMRLLWECQCVSLDGIGVGAERSACREAMIACVLAFPSLIAKVRWHGAMSSTSSDLEGFSTETSSLQSSRSIWRRAEAKTSLRVEFEPQCAPQDVQVHVNIPPTSASSPPADYQLSMRLVGPIRFFDWQDWKDAFEGRCEWLRRNDMRPCPSDIRLPMQYEHSSVQKDEEIPEPSSAEPPTTPDESVSSSLSDWIANSTVQATNTLAQNKSQAHSPLLFTNNEQQIRPPTAEEGSLSLLKDLTPMLPLSDNSDSDRSLLLSEEDANSTLSSNAFTSSKLPPWDESLYSSDEHQYIPGWLNWL